jgi:hypothetical protein
MKTTSNAILLAVSAIAILTFASPADASETPEKTFRVVTTDKDGSPIVEVGRGVDVGAIVRSFGNMYRDSTTTKEKPEGETLTWQIIHSANPNAVIPVCRVPQDGNMWAGRGDTSVWDSCPASDRYIGLIAGHSGHIRIPIKTVETYEQKETRVSKLVNCFDSVACLNERIVALGGKPVVTPVAPPEPATPIQKSQPSTSSSSTNGVSTDEVIKGVLADLEKVQNERDQLSIDNASLLQRPSWLAVLPLFMLAFVVGAVLGRFKRHPRENVVDDLATTMVYEKPKPRRPLPAPVSQKRPAQSKTQNDGRNKTVDLEVANSNLNISLGRAEALNSQLNIANDVLIRENATFKSRLAAAERQLLTAQCTIAEHNALRKKLFGSTGEDESLEKTLPNGNGSTMFIPRPPESKPPDKTLATTTVMEEAQPSSKIPRPESGAKPVDINDARLKAARKRHVAEIERLHGDYRIQLKVAEKRVGEIEEALKIAKAQANQNFNLCLSSEGKRDELKAEIERLKMQLEESYRVTGASGQAIDVTMQELARSLLQRAKPFVLMGFVYRSLVDIMDTLAIPDQELVRTLDAPTRKSLLQQMPLLDCVIKLREAGIIPPQLETLPRPVLSATG